MLYIDICSDSVNELEHLYSLVKSYQKNHIQVGVRVRRFHSFYDLILRMREEGSFTCWTAAGERAGWRAFLPRPFCGGWIPRESR